jgi:hypothetical protein
MFDLYFLVVVFLLLMIFVMVGVAFLTLLEHRVLGYVHIHKDDPYRITSTKCHINTVVSPDDEHSRPKHVDKRDKHTKKNRAPSWLYLQHYTRMHSQQNIKFYIFVTHCASLKLY